jgi:hypothetical protein
MAFRRSLEMTLSREEFLRLLPAAVPAFNVDGDAVSWSNEGRLQTIRLIRLTPRRMASAVLSRHRVEITLHACTEEEGEAFMARFHRAFLRGGG